MKEDVVQSQFLLLLELQRTDDRLRTLRDEQQNLPHKLRPYELACVAARQTLAQLHEEIEQAERRRRACDRELDNAQAQLAKTHHRLREVKTNKEYSAVLAEIDTGKHHIGTLEDQVLELMEMTEQQRRAYQQQEQRVQEAVQELAAQRTQMQQTYETLAQNIAAEETRRQRLVSDLDLDIYARYQRFVTQRNVLAVVQVRDGTCSGCHLKIQPQLVSEIRRQDKLLQCPHCQRMLLWPAE